MRSFRVIFTSVLLIFLALAVHVRTAPAVEEPREAEEAEGLVFFFPLVADSPTPANEMRFDYLFFNEPGEEEEPGAYRNTLRLLVEYAFARWFSVEVSVPYTFLDPDGEPRADRLDNIETRFEYANFAFEKRGLVLSGGLAFTLPTGNEERGIGSDHLTVIEPFLMFGYKIKGLEIIGETSFGVPVNDNHEDEAPDLELGWNLSFLYNIMDRLKALVEFDGESDFGGEEDGFSTANITPGLKVRPVDGKDLFINAGVRLPLTKDREFHVNTVLSITCAF
jgi:hypothetical protein